MPTALTSGDRVRHNYASGHGDGTVVGVREPSDERLAVDVMWDSGQGPFPYTCNAETMEIVRLGHRSKGIRGEHAMRGVD